ncbi:hypothetical protein GDO86_009112 [Hymenochirus boettgeri]|uniref:Calpain catalytic domain-containing protein n=1 Tax=Hymenochirus boettgeri TaxID=247094 RepID=A0A8T2JHP1_9PIPI|nr:hypothetical protein GDO86_009112 [Hymenochirus boettgeri]
MALDIGTNSEPKKHLGQDYEQLKEQCLASSSLFEDEAFPACQQSLGTDPKKLGPDTETAQGIVWLRPSEICTSPEFITKGASRFDICQQGLGDCWFLCSIGSLTLSEEHLYQVVPKDQSFQEGYAGIFHYKFWQQGEWVDVVVDDKLPTKNGQLVFVCSSQSNEFWSPLLEKAYAKLKGSYEKLDGGVPIEALEDFTGGICEIIFLNEAPSDLFKTVRRSVRAQSLLTCSSKGEGEQNTADNVVTGHGYSITGAEEVTYHGNKEQLIRVRNPWGNTEWTGAWSDSAPEWDEIDPAVKDALLVQREDGEVWMPFSELIKNYSELQICNISSTSGSSQDGHQWTLDQIEGTFISGSSVEVFMDNPQFRFTLEVPDDDQDGVEDEPLCTVIVSLIMKLTEEQDVIVNDFDIYKAQWSSDIELEELKCVSQSTAYKRESGISRRFRLPIGEYVMAPNTPENGEDAEFYLRVFSARKSGVDDTAITFDA